MRSFSGIRNKTKDTKVLFVWKEMWPEDKDRRQGTRGGSGYGLFNGDGTIESLSPENGYAHLCDKYNDKISKSEKLTKIINHVNPDVVCLTRPVSYDTLTDVIIRIQNNGNGNGNGHNGKKVTFTTTPEIYEKHVGRLKGKIKTNGDILPVLDLKREYHKGYYLFLKRLFDILFSLILLILALPVFLITALLIKLTSKGPVFYNQVRAGINGYPFKLYKFRSMKYNPEDSISQCINLDRFNQPVYKFSSDSRITPIGRVLRKTSIDELPQLFNVLKGDMSWVGPRPEDIRIVERYNAFFKERLRVRPGITGFQQVKCRGIPDMMERMNWDLKYIENRSLLMDLRIIFLSVFVVISKKGAW